MFSGGPVGTMGAITPPPKRARKIFSNVTGNKSSDRELIFTFWYSRKRL